MKYKYNNSHKKNWYENIIWKMAPILSWPQCIEIQEVILPTTHMEVKYVLLCIHPLCLKDSSFPYVNSGTLLSPSHSLTDTQSNQCGLSDGGRIVYWYSGIMGQWQLKKNKQQKYKLQNYNMLKLWGIWTSNNRTCCIEWIMLNYVNSL